MMGATMQLARIHGPGDVRLDTVAVPEAGPGEAIVRVAACGICGSDLSYIAQGGLGGPLGEPLPIESLPAPDTTRWVVRRKAEVVAAVNGGLLTVDEACERYGLTLEEFAGWQRSIDRSGMPGLRVTRIQHYRDLYERQQRF